MSHNGSPYFAKTFVEWCAINGYQRYYQPSTVELPPGITLNEYGWINCPTNTDIIIPLVEVRPGEKRELYWFSERIICESPSPVRINLEGNFTYDESTGTFDPNGWKTTKGMIVSDVKDHEWSGGLLKTKAGEALRLRVFPNSGNQHDFYFKFVAYDVPS